jgi:type I restriction-modification system DNA methylase subunit
MVARLRALGQLKAEVDQGADPEDPDEYRAINVFWVPKEARWSHLQDNAKQPTIGKLIDDAMVAIERDASPRARPTNTRFISGPIADPSSGRGFSISQSRELDCRVAVGYATA